MDADVFESAKNSYEEELSDEDLMSNFTISKKSNDFQFDANKCMIEIISRYDKMISSIINKFVNSDADKNDISQEIYVKIYQESSSFNPSCGSTID